MSYKKLLRAIKAGEKSEGRHLLVSRLPDPTGANAGIVSERPSYAAWANRQRSNLQRVTYKNEYGLLREARNLSPSDREAWAALGMRVQPVVGDNAVLSNKAAAETVAIAKKRDKAPGRRVVRVGDNFVVGHFSARQRGVKEFSILNKISNFTGMAQIKAGRKALEKAKWSRKHALLASPMRLDGGPAYGVRKFPHAREATREARQLINEGRRRRHISIGVGAGVAGLGAGAGYLATRKESNLAAKLRGLKEFEDYKLYYFRGRNTGIAARSAEEARKKKKRGGDELVAVRTPNATEKSQMARGIWVRTRRDGKSPGQSRYGKGRGQGPARKSMGAKIRGVKEFAMISVKTDRVSADHAAARRAIIEKYGKPDYSDLQRQAKARDTGIAVIRKDGPSITASMNNPDSPFYVPPEKREEQRLRAKEWHRINRLRHLASRKESNLAARHRAIKFFEKKKEKKSGGLNPYVGAALSGFGSGAALGSLALLRRGATFRSAAKTAAKLGIASAGIVGGGALLGSKIIGNPREDEGAPFTKRAAIGGALVGSGAGLAGALLLRKTKGGARALVGASKKTEPFSRPAMWLRKTPLVGAAGIGAVGGALYGGAMGADEGQQVDSIRNLRKDIKTHGLSRRLRRLKEFGVASNHSSSLGRKKELAMKLFGRGDQPRYARNKAWAPPVEAYAKDIPLVDNQGNPWNPSSPQLANALWRDASKARVGVQRGGRLTKDVSDVIQGKARERDASGRIKKREWEKSWFQNALVTGALAGGLGGTVLLRRWARNNPRTAVGAFTRNVEAWGKRRVRDGQNALANAMGGLGHVTSGPGKTFAARLAKLKEFDAIAASAGWDVRDPRGRSARVFAPGSRRRDRREKAWHEKTENERKLWKAGIAAGIIGGGLAGIGLYRIGTGRTLIPRFGNAAAGAKSAVQSSQVKVKEMLDYVKRYPVTKTKPEKPFIAPWWANQTNAA